MLAVNPPPSPCCCIPPQPHWIDCQFFPSDHQRASMYFSPPSDLPSKGHVHSRGHSPTVAEGDRGSLPRTNFTPQRPNSKRPSLAKNNRARLRLSEPTWPERGTETGERGEQGTSCAMASIWQAFQDGMNSAEAEVLREEEEDRKRAGKSGHGEQTSYGGGAHQGTGAGREKLLRIFEMERWRDGMLKTKRRTEGRTNRDLSDGEKRCRCVGSSRELVWGSQGHV
jgi:hypothetical protein